MDKEKLNMDYVEDPLKNFPSGDIEDNPIYWMNLVIKLLKNYPTILKVKIKGGGFDSEQKEILVYNLCLKYIERFEVVNPYHILALKKFGKPSFKRSLEQILSYFEKREEYEKCGSIYKIIKILR